MMHFYAHQARAAAKKSKRETLFVIVERNREYRDLVLYSQAERAVLELVKQNRFVCGNTAFGKDTDTEPLVKPFLYLSRRWCSSKAAAFLRCSS